MKSISKYQQKDMKHCISKGNRNIDTRQKTTLLDKTYP